LCLHECLHMRTEVEGRHRTTFEMG
jgi:hypothetical protein